VYSELGHGTSFRIYLPLIAGAGVLEVEKAPTDELSRGGTETILLVEDEEAILEVSKVILAELGYHVLAAATPGAAVREAESHPGGIDLLVTDVIMPQMNGRELSLKLAARQPGLKCLFVSGYTADAIGQHGLLEKGVHFLSKPFTTSQLAEKIRKVLDGSAEEG
jgi:CheY-like chemotaxis protein